MIIEISTDTRDRITSYASVFGTFLFAVSDTPGMIKVDIDVDLHRRLMRINSNADDALNHVLDIFDCDLHIERS